MMSKNNNSTLLLLVENMLHYFIYSLLFKLTEFENLFFKKVFGQNGATNTAQKNTWLKESVKLLKQCSEDTKGHF